MPPLIQAAEGLQPSRTKHCPAHTTRSSDFPRACMPEVRSQTLSGRPAAPPASTRGIPRFPREEFPRMHSVFDCAGSEGNLPVTPPSAWSSASLNCIGTPHDLISHLDGWPTCALSTLRRHPCGRRRMRRSRDDGLRACYALFDPAFASRSATKASQCHPSSVAVSRS
jgi:hypothetical protein